MNQVEQISNMVDGVIEFDTPVTVKITPHSTAVNIYGIEKTEAGDVFVHLMDGTPIRLDQCNEPVKASLLQRLKLVNG